MTRVLVTGGAGFVASVGSEELCLDYIAWLGTKLIDYMKYIFVAVPMTTTTISISDEVRRHLVKVAAELQANLGERIDYDRVIRYLLSRVTRNESLLREACAPVPVKAEELRAELRKGRSENRRQESTLERKHS